MSLTCVAASEAEVVPRLAGTSYEISNVIAAFDATQPGPQAFLVRQRSPELRAHFHEVDQFQVVRSGSGTIGRDHASRGLVHYADAYTAYGPIRTDDRLEYLTLRRDPTTSANFMPEFRGKRRRGAGAHFTARVVPSAEPGRLTEI